MVGGGGLVRRLDFDRKTCTMKSLELVPKPGSDHLMHRLLVCTLSTARC